MPEEWKESIVVPIYKKGDKTDCSNYRRLSLLPTTYKIVSKILQRKLLETINLDFDAESFHMSKSS